MPDGPRTSRALYVHMQIRVHVHAQVHLCVHMQMNVRVHAQMPNDWGARSRLGRTYTHPHNIRIHVHRLGRARDEVEEYSLVMTHLLGEGGQGEATAPIKRLNDELTNRRQFLSFLESFEEEVSGS